MKRVGVCAFLVRCSLCARCLFLHLEQAVDHAHLTMLVLSCQEPPPTPTGIKLGLYDQYCENGVQVVISSVWLDAANKQ